MNDWGCLAGSCDEQNKVFIFRFLQGNLFFGGIGRFVQTNHEGWKVRNAAPIT